MSSDTLQSSRMEKTKILWDRYVPPHPPRIYVLTLLGVKVQYVYLAMSCLGIVVNVLFFFAKLPEVAQVVSADTKDVVSVKGFFKKYHTIAGFFAEFFYVSTTFEMSRGYGSLPFPFFTGRRSRYMRSRPDAGLTVLTYCFTTS